jgi:hypothetical protein
MKKTGVVGAAAIVFLMAYPAMAQHAVSRCQHHQLGNPYTPEQDYMAWSAWRARGNWAEPSQPCPRAIHPRHHSTKKVR